MKSKNYWIEWIKAAGMRAIKTMAQTAVGVLTGAVLFTEVNWALVASAAAMAGVMSLLMSLAGLPEVSEEAGKHEEDS